MSINTTSPAGEGAELYSSSLSYRGAVCCAGFSAVTAGTWLSDDSSFSVLEPGGAVFIGGVARAAVVETEENHHKLKELCGSLTHWWTMFQFGSIRDTDRQ